MSEVPLIRYMLVSWIFLDGRRLPTIHLGIWSDPDPGCTAGVPRVHGWRFSPRARETRAWNNVLGVLCWLLSYFSPDISLMIHCTRLIPAHTDLTCFLQPLPALCSKRATCSTSWPHLETPN